MSIKNTPKRRRRPYGSVFRRPGGPGWLVRIPHPEGGKTASGRPRYLTRSVGSKAEGEALLREVRKASLTGTLAAPEPEEPCELTILEAIDGHIDALRARGCSEKTVGVHACSQKAIERHGLGHTKVCDLTAAQVESYLAWRRKHVWRTKCRPGKPPKAILVKGGKASASTVGRDRELMSAAINRLIRLGQMNENVVAKVPKPKRPKATRTVLSKAEIAKLFSVCGEQLRPVVMALAYTGARKAEVLRLRWRDICFDTGSISLYRPKVSNFSRIPMHPALAAELRRIREGRPKAKDSDAVFLSRLGTPYKDFKEAFGTAVRRAGLQDRDVTAHCLRHSFACHFLENGAAVTDLQAVLGHASLVTTQIYARMVDRRTRSSVEALDFGAPA